MMSPTSEDYRRRDDRELRKRVGELRQHMREQGIQERRGDWRDFAKAASPTRLWDTVPTGTGLVKRLAEPLKLLFDSARMLILSGPTPEILAVRGGHMEPTPMQPGVSGPPAKPVKWRLPAEGNVPMIELRVYRRENGEVMLHCRVPDLPPEQVGLELRERSGRGSFRGRLADLVAGDIGLGAGAWTLKLTFTHITPPPVREIPLDIGVLPDV